METKAQLYAMGFEPTPVLKAIRAKCLDCAGGSHAEIADCLVKSCALYPFRMGANPWRAEASEAQREAARKAAAAHKNRRALQGSGATAGVAATTLPAVGEIASTV
jgi:hypothetical protein